MDVCIVEAGHHEVALQIDNARVAGTPGRQLGIVAHGDDVSVLHCDRACPGSQGIDCVNPRVAVKDGLRIRRQGYEHTDDTQDPCAQTA
jgi:hypothetical protein